MKSRLLRLVAHIQAASFPSRRREALRALGRGRFVLLYGTLLGLASGVASWFLVLGIRWAQAEPLPGLLLFLKSCGLGVVVGTVLAVMVWAILTEPRPDRRR